MVISGAAPRGAVPRGAVPRGAGLCGAGLCERLRERFGNRIFNMFATTEAGWAAPADRQFRTDS
ncbi:hypothetical protein [Actinoplanes sp. NPDC049802]|uniref:hypothetical protein n=1 Tax=Actinoplanes sp. NPDC049802 TaxID=3154742 RepID=UPI0033FDA9F8